MTKKGIFVLLLRLLYFLMDVQSKVKRVQHLAVYISGDALIPYQCSSAVNAVQLFIV